MTSRGHDAGTAPAARRRRGAASAGRTSLAEHPLADRVVQRVLRGFFAESRSVAMRYGTTPERVLEHLDAVGAMAQATAVRQLHWVEDLVVATACCDGHPRAWVDASQHYQSVLVRAARIRLEEAEAEVFVQRFWSDLEQETLLRRASTESRRHERPALQDYVGTRPLRTWLIDRVLGRLECEARAQTWSAARTLVLPSHAGDGGPLRLAD